MEPAIPELKRILFHPPSMESWKDLIDFFGQLDASPQQETLLHYAEKHILSWPLEFRDGSRLSFSNCIWPLVRKYSFFSIESQLPLKEKKFSSLSQIHDLHLHAPLLRDLRGIETCARLRKLSLQENMMMKTLAGIQALTELKQLVLRDHYALEDIGALFFCRDLEEITFHHCSAIQKMDVLVHLPKLRKIKIIDCGSLRDLQWIRSLKNLCHLEIKDCWNLHCVPEKEWMVAPEDILDFQNKIKQLEKK